MNKNIPTNKLISILIVTYNSEKFILKTINSCLNQTYHNFEILILDNASKDNTVSIIKKLKNKKIKLFCNKDNIGPYNGLNFLIKKSKGKFIAIQDHDDLWLPRKLEKQIRFLEQHSKRNSCGTYTYYFYESKNLLILDKRGEEINFVDHTSLVFRNDNYLYDTNYLLTDEYFEKIILKGNINKIHCLPVGLTIRRIRNDRNNLSRTRFKFNLKNIKEYLSINGVKISSVVNLFGIFVAKFFPPSLEWLIIKLIKRKSIKITLSQFQKKHPNLI